MFVEKRLIPPNDICNILAGALFNLHFELYHYSIRSKDIDSFNAKIEQLMVLQPGKTQPDTIYKCSMAKEGPIRMNPALAAILDEAPPFSCLMHPNLPPHLLYWKTHSCRVSVVHPHHVQISLQYMLTSFA